jgi:hypothetical protein
LSGALTSPGPPGFLPATLAQKIDTEMIDKTYQPSEVEGRIYAAW